MSGETVGAVGAACCLGEVTSESPEQVISPTKRLFVNTPTQCIRMQTSKTDLLLPMLATVHLRRNQSFSISPKCTASVNSEPEKTSYRHM